MYENPNWHALEILFGLLGCSVPPSLKAHLIDAITQFAKSPSLVNKVSYLFFSLTFYCLEA
jgi:hypothetical protein